MVSMEYKDDDSSYSENDHDGDDDDEEYMDDSHNNRSIGSSEADLNQKPRSKVAAANNNKRPRNAVDGPMNDDLAEIDEDEEEEKEPTADTKLKRTVVRPLKPDELYVNWGDILQHSTSTTSAPNHTKSLWWVHQPFINHNLPLIEIDKLIGYATHITTYHHPCTIATNTISPATTATSSNIRQARTFHNPLLGLPSTPMRPTVLKHLILEPATKLTSSYIQHQQRYHRNVFDDDTDDIEDDQNDDDDDHPRPKKHKKKHLNQSSLYERFHHSAAMAIAMFTEEMMTATLLPLAQQYVQYCRHHNHHDNEDCRVWTLPPEEAILKMYNDRNNPVGETTSSLLSTRIPTRSIVSGAIGTSMLNQPNKTDHERIAYDNWCRTSITTDTTETTTATSSKIRQQWIEKDASFFQLLIQNIPTLQRPESTTADTLTTPTVREMTTTAITTPIPTDTADDTNQTAYEI